MKVKVFHIACKLIAVYFINLFNENKWYHLLCYFIAVLNAISIGIMVDLFKNDFTYNRIQQFLSILIFIILLIKDYIPTRISFQRLFPKTYPLDKITYAIIELLLQIVSPIYLAFYIFLFYQIYFSFEEIRYIQLFTDLLFFTLVTVTLNELITFWRWNRYFKFLLLILVITLFIIFKYSALNANIGLMLLFVLSAFLTRVFILDASDTHEKSIKMIFSKRIMNHWFSIHFKLIVSNRRFLGLIFLGTLIKFLLCLVLIIGVERHKFSQNELINFINFCVLPISIFTYVLNNSIVFIPVFFILGTRGCDFKLVLKSLMSIIFIVVSFDFLLTLVVFLSVHLFSFDTLCRYALGIILFSLVAMLSAIYLPVYISKETAKFISKPQVSLWSILLNIAIIIIVVKLDYAFILTTILILILVNYRIFFTNRNRAIQRIYQALK